MENRAYALAAGLFTLLLGFGIVAAALWFSGQTVETEDYLLVSRHPVTGLNTQAPVRYRGLTVGKVVSIELDSKVQRNNEPRDILVQISIKAGTPLTKGSFAKLGSQGVTGLAYVMLDDDGSKPEPLAAGGDNLARIELRPSFMDTITASGEEMVKNFNQVAKRVDTLLGDENQKQLLSTLRNVDQASGKLVTLADEIEPTLRKLPAIADETSVVLTRADAFLTNLNGRVDSFERAAKSHEQLGRSGSAMADALATESLPRLNMLLEDLQRTSLGLERLLTEVNDQPQSLLFGKRPMPPGPGEPGFAARREAR